MEALGDPAAALPTVRALLARAEAAQAAAPRVPCAPLVSEETYPKAAGVRALLRLLETAAAARAGPGAEPPRGGGSDPAPQGGAAAGCWRCGGAGGAGLRACGGCGVARYCGRACQKEDWARHKPVCRAVRAGPGGAGQPAGGPGDRG